MAASIPASKKSTKDSLTLALINWALDENKFEQVFGKGASPDKVAQLSGQQVLAKVDAYKKLAASSSTTSSSMGSASLSSASASSTDDTDAPTPTMLAYKAKARGKKVKANGPLGGDNAKKACHSSARGPRALSKAEIEKLYRDYINKDYKSGTKTLTALCDELVEKSLE
jgi:hypothetical protein